MGTLIVQGPTEMSQGELQNISIGNARSKVFQRYRFIIDENSLPPGFYQKVVVIFFSLYIVLSFRIDFKDLYFLWKIFIRKFYSNLMNFQKQAKMCVISEVAFFD